MLYLIAALSIMHMILNSIVIVKIIKLKKSISNITVVSTKDDTPKQQRPELPDERENSFFR